MADLTRYERKALEYVRNADGPLASDLRYDFEPIGGRLLDVLKRHGFVEAHEVPAGERLLLTTAGREELATDAERATPGGGEADG